MGDSTPPPSPDIDPSLLAHIEAHAVDLAREAGALLLGYFHQRLTVEFKSKGQRDPVTEADRKAEELIASGIRSRFPEHGILGEETPEPQGLGNDFLWVVDPLDGTNNFVNHYPIFAVSIGVLYKSVPVAGALFIPSPLTSEGRVFHARVGGGAFAEDTPIHVYQGEEPSSEGLLTMHTGFWRQFRPAPELRRAMGDVRITGSIAYELALVASGALQYSGFLGPKIWDVAGGLVIVREAGGEVLLRSGRRRWEPLRSFAQAGGGLPADGDLRKWRTWLLIGAPSIVTAVASGLRPRPRLWLWLRRRLAAARRLRSRA